MGIDSSIISRLVPAQIQQSDPLERYGKSLALKNLMMQGEQGERALADENAVRDAYRQSGGDSKALRALLQSGGQYKQIQALDKFELENEAKRATIGKDKAAAGKSQFDVDMGKLEHGAALLNEAKDPQTFATVLRVGQLTGTFAPEFVTKMTEQGYSPQLVSSLQSAGMTRAKQLEDERLRETLAQTVTRDTNTNQRGIESNLTTQRGQNMIQGTAMRGQNLADARAATALDQGRTPPGYRATPEGNLAAIPGGPADTKLQGVMNQDTAILTSSSANMDRLATAANEAMKHPGLAGTAGLRGAIPNVPGTAAADAAALLNTLKSQVAFGVLQDMRNNSKTGGALGNVSDAEGKRLEANLAALEKSQSVEQLRSNLQKIVDYTEGAKDRLREAFNLKHQGKADAPKPSPAPESPKVFNAMPDPAKYAGKRIESDDGTVYKSVGGKWVRQ